MMIVDGWTLPIVQSQSYASFLRNWGLIAGQSTKDILYAQTNIAININSQNYKSAQ